MLKLFLREPLSQQHWHLPPEGKTSDTVLAMAHQSEYRYFEYGFVIWQNSNQEDSGRLELGESFVWRNRVP